MEEYSKSVLRSGALALFFSCRVQRSGRPANIGCVEQR